MRPKTAVVAIGRNEGLRLERCLQSAIDATDLVVYVDSGSIDQSVSYAISAGAMVVELDSSKGFTAARARNAGFNQAIKADPDIEFIQFVDGDCELLESWIPTALDFLEKNPQAAVVCGQRKEKFPEQSIYNQLCALEWKREPGATTACGGDALFRVSALTDAGGFNDTLIAGEEPELCFRLRGLGWDIQALPNDMTLHDANMTRFSQWWNRNSRSGYAYIEGALLHRDSRDRYWVWESLRTWVWTVGVFGACIAATHQYGAIGLGIYLVYLLQVLRLAFRERGPTKIRWASAFFTMLARFPELEGQLRFFWNRGTRRTSELIEYK